MKKLHPLVAAARTMFLSFFDGQRHKRKRAYEMRRCVRASLAVLLALLPLIPRSALGDTRVLGGNGDDSVESLCPLSGGDLLLLGETFSESNTGDVADTAGAAPLERSTAWAVRLNPEGEVVWQTCYANKNIANTRFIAGIEQDGQLSLYATGGEVGNDALVLLDEEGRKKRIVPMPKDVDVCEVCPSERGLILAGRTWDDAAFRPWCALLDASGQTVWSYTGEPFARLEGRCYYERVDCGDGRIALYEQRIPFAYMEGYETFLTVLDFDGNLLSRARIDVSPLQYVAGITVQDDAVLFFGSSYDGKADLHTGAVVKLDDTGRLCWNWSAPALGDNSDIEDLLLLEDRYFICSTRYDYRSSRYYSHVLTGSLSFEGDAQGLQMLPEKENLTNPKVFSVSQDELVLVADVFIKGAGRGWRKTMDIFITQIQR